MDPGNLLNNKVHVRVLHGLPGPNLEYAAAMKTSKIASKIGHANVIQPDIITKRMERNGPIKILLNVQVIKQNNSHVVVFMAIGHNGQSALYLVLTKMRVRQSELANEIAMIQLQTQVNLSIKINILKNLQAKHANLQNKLKWKYANVHSARNAQTLKHHVQVSMKNA